MADMWVVAVAMRMSVMVMREGANQRSNYLNEIFSSQNFLPVPKIGSNFNTNFWKR